MVFSYFEKSYSSALVCRGLICSWLIEYLQVLKTGFSPALAQGMKRPFYWCSLLSVWNCTGYSEN